MQKKSLDINTDKSYCPVCHNTGQVLDLHHSQLATTILFLFEKGWDRNSKTGEQG